MWEIGFQELRGAALTIIPEVEPAGHLAEYGAPARISSRYFGDVTHANFVNCDTRKMGN
jgi:hypothetical protein